MVEDDVGTQILIAEAAREAGFAADVTLLRTAGEALAYLDRSGRGDQAVPSLVLLDIRLPDQSGLEVLRKMRANRMLRNVPVVVFSGSTDPLDLDRAYEAGANGYVPKPLRYQELADALKSALEYWVHVNLSPEPPTQTRPS